MVVLKRTSIHFVPSPSFELPTYIIVYIRVVHKGAYAGRV